MWASYLSGDTHGLDRTVRFVRSMFKHLPSEPRCHVCNVPFAGAGGVALRAVGYTGGRSRLNPNLCGRCERIVKQYEVGVETEVTLLFADVRGSTSLAEELGAAAFHDLIDRFYRVAADIFVECGGLIENLVGDEVASVFAPGIAGPGHAAKALTAARTLLEATGHDDPAGPWLPIGVGIHTGQVYAGAVGTGESVGVVTVLGDTANTTARLASAAARGEIMISETAARGAHLEADEAEKRSIELRGRSAPIDIRVLRIGE